MGKFSKGSGVKIGDPEGMFYSPRQTAVPLDAHKKAMMKSKWGITMDREVDTVSEIVRMFRKMDGRDRALTLDLLSKIDLSDAMAMNSKALIALEEKIKS